MHFRSIFLTKSTGVAMTTMWLAIGLETLGFHTTFMISVYNRNRKDSCVCRKTDVHSKINGVEWYALREYCQISARVI
uniref:Secreted protein n=1 Tax=Romanomermis culicivorax TaxID=13658 RepID=A0A915IU55_ROMCU